MSRAPSSSPRDGAWRRSPIAQLTMMRLREFTREPEAVFWAVFFPILLAAGLGVAFGGGPSTVITVAATTPELSAVLADDPGLDSQTLDPPDAREALRRGRVALVADTSPDGVVTYHYDDTRPEGRTARMLADQAVQRAAGRADPVSTMDDVSRDRGSRYIDFLVPGLVGLGIMSNAVWGLGFSIVDARRRRLTKRLLATPMSRAHYLLSYLLWRMMILAIEVSIPIGFGALAFGVPVRGSWLAIVLLCVLASLCFSSLGLLVASRARTIEAVSGLMNLVVLPMWLLSGIFFSAQRFPDALQPIIGLLPLTAFVDALRGVMLQSEPLSAFSGQVLTLSLWCVATFAVALKIFRWR